MTVSGSTLKNIYTLDESTTVFPYTFKITQNSDMLVTLYNTTTKVGTELELDTDYTIVGAGLDSGTRNVTYTGASSYGSTYQLILQPSVPYTQPTDYEENDDFAEETHELALDRLSIQIRQLKELLDRTFKLDASQDSDVEFPAASAGYLYSNGTSFSWDDITFTTTDYDGTISQGADASKPSNPVIGDIYFATDTNKLYGCWTTSTWSVDWVLGDITAGDIAVDDIDAATGIIDSLEVTTITGTDATITGDLTVGTGAFNDFFDEDDMSSDSATAVASQQSIKAYTDAITTAMTLSGISDYGTSGTTGTAKTQDNLFIVYGTRSVGQGASSTVTNLPFTSASSYVVIVTIDGTDNVNIVPKATRQSGSQCTIVNDDGDEGTQTIMWLAIGT